MVKIIFWCFFLLPWLSLFFLKSSTIRRYMPVALLATVINTIVYQIAWTHHWWRYKETLFSWDKIAQVHTVYGVFLIGTIWIFFFTYRKFWIYLLVNLIIDSMYSFGFGALWRKLGITEGGKNYSPLYSVLIMLVISVILFIYQMWQEGRIGKGNEKSIS